MILKKAFRWSLVLLFWLFLLGWGISVFAAEWTVAPTAYKGTCKYASTTYGTGWLPSQCTTYYQNLLKAQAPNNTVSFVQNWAASGTGSSSFQWTFKSCTPSNTCAQTALVLNTTGGPVAYCPPDGKPDFTVGPKTVNGQQVCEKVPISCKVGEQLYMNPTTGAESCKENCASVTGQVLTNVAYNKAFLPSATVTCYGLCSVTSQGTTIEVPADGFTQHGDVQFTGEKCPVTFPDQGTGQPVYNDQPTSSQQTNNAQNQLQNAASGATSNQVSGATGTADLNAVVNKLAETSNAQIKAMSEQNAAMGKVIEGVGKDIQGAIREGNANNGGGGAGNSVGQMQTANAIKEGNQTLKEIKDKLDEQQNPEPPVSPGTNLDADAKSIHEANDWNQRNFGTVLTANATRFRALPIFALPTTFFTVNLGGAACPTYTGSFTVMGSTQTITLDAFCSSTVMNVMPFIRAVVMMVFGWLAWRIAIGNGG
ncbi:TPA: hypothetical protein JAJ28_000116 [Aeromonas hydrophila]|uniref:Uncharacterized protein n=1 Tax=Aeromonas hydrophila TaxID=644 RepID=A0AAD3U748_AERHY|nr:hypothetical protein [Aeromonas hydrophila]